MLSALILAVSLFAQNQTSDAAVVAKRLDKAVSALAAEKIRPAEFEKTVTRKFALQADRLFSNAPHASVIRVESAFAAAYYRINYRRNIQALVALFDYKPDKQISVMPKLGEDTTYEQLLGDPEDASFAVTCLYMLFNRSHSSLVLNSLVNLPADASDGEDLVGILQGEWNSHRKEMLISASSSKYGVRNISSALFDNYETVKPGTEHKYYVFTLAELRRWSYNSDPRVSRAASDIRRAFIDVVATNKRVYGKH